MSWEVIGLFMAFVAIIIGFAAHSLGFARGYSTGLDLKSTLSERLDKPKPVPGDLVAAIREANLTRHHGNLIRRIMKQMEELGEVAEAYLNVTSFGNGKGKTWADVREEMADQVIVAVDCALTATPDQEVAGVSQDEIEAAMMAVIHTKLAKWKNNRDTGRSASDA